eukprot:806426-Pelagomonas_calceolata.AAC.2
MPTLQLGWAPTSTQLPRPPLQWPLSPPLCLAHHAPLQAIKRLQQMSTQYSFMGTWDKGDHCQASRMQMRLRSALSLPAAGDSEGL